MAFEQLGGADRALERERVALVLVHLLEERADEERQRDVLRRQTDTRELIQQDRDNHRLRLHVLDSMTRTVAIDELKNVCRILGIVEARDISTSVEPSRLPAVGDELMFSKLSCFIMGENR